MWERNPRPLHTSPLLGTSETLTRFMELAAQPIELIADGHRHFVGAMPVAAIPELSAHQAASCRSSCVPKSAASCTNN